MSVTIRLAGDSQRRYAHQQIERAPVGHVVKIGAETRRDAQNRKLWPMLQDLVDQVPTCAGFSKDDMKLRFLNALGVEMNFLPALEGQGMFPVGLKSSTLTVAQFSALIELVYKFGAENNVCWSEPMERAA